MREFIIEQCPSRREAWDVFIDGIGYRHFQKRDFGNDETQLDKYLREEYLKRFDNVK